MKNKRESEIETYLVKKVKELGGEPYKFSSPNRRNVPDRMCMFKDSHICFVEVKAPGKKPSDGQAREHKRLWDMGHRVAIVDTKEAVDFLIDNIKLILAGRQTA